jgi:hypothetical protein
VLVLILCVVYAAIRREGLPAVSASNMTVGELVAALQMAREVGSAQRSEPRVTKPDSEPGPEAAEPAEENVTALSSARYTK